MHTARGTASRAVRAPPAVGMWPRSPPAGLAPERADAVRLLALVRGQWQIEPHSYGVRDVTFDEERSQVRCGNIPPVMAALRNTVLGLIRWAGHTNMAAACRRVAAQPQAALHLIGITLENCMALTDAAGGGKGRLIFLYSHLHHFLYGKNLPL